MVFDEARTPKSVDQAGNGSADASDGRADATRHHVLVQMGPVSLWVQDSSGATVVVMQAAEHGESDDLAGLWLLHLWRDGNTLADAPSTALRAGLVRAGTVEVVGVLPDHLGQMALVEDEHVVETLSP